MPSFSPFFFIAVAVASLGLGSSSARVTFLEASEVISSDLTASSSAILGAPDSPDRQAGAGSSWAGLGNGQVILRFPESTRNERPVAAGVARTNRANFVLYEHQGGVPEPDKVRVEWRYVSPVGAWREAEPTQSFAETLKDNHETRQRFGYNIGARDDEEIEVRLTGLASQPPGQSDTGAPGFDLDAVARITREVTLFRQNVFSVSSLAYRDLETVRRDDETWVTVATRPGTPTTWQLFPGNARTRAVSTGQQEAAAEVRGDPGANLRRAHLATRQGRLVVAVHYDEKVEFIRFDNSFQESGRATYSLPAVYRNQPEVALDLCLSQEGVPIALLAGGRSESLLLTVPGSGWQSGQVEVLSFLPAQSEPGAVESIAESPTIQVRRDGMVYAGLVNFEDFGAGSPEGILTLSKLPLVDGIVQGFGSPLASRQILQSRFDGVGELGSSITNDRFVVIGGFDFGGEITVQIFREEAFGDFDRITGFDEFLGINTKFEVAQRPDGEIVYAYFDESFRTNDQPSIVYGTVRRGAMFYRVLEEGRGVNLEAGLSMALSARGDVVLTVGRFGRIFNRPFGTLTHLVSADFEDFDRNGLSGLAELAGLGSLEYIEPSAGFHGGRMVLRFPLDTRRDQFSQAELWSADYCYTLEKFSAGKWSTVSNKRIKSVDVFKINNTSLVVWEFEESDRPSREILQVTVERY